MVGRYLNTGREGTCSEENVTGPLRDEKGNAKTWRRGIGRRETSAMYLAMYCIVRISAMSLCM